MSTDEATTATTEPAGDAIPASSPSPSDPLWVERTGSRTYRGRSGRGATVEIGPAGSGARFTPGELLKIALAACAGMSSDVPLARRLGDDYQVTISVDGPKDLAEDRYPELAETIELDLGGLDDAARERLLKVADRAIDQSCTVEHTLTAGVAVGRRFVDKTADPVDSSGDGARHP
jgi:uncharacterized OsmC-like protein